MVKKKKRTMRSISPFFFRGDPAISEVSTASNLKNAKKSQLLFSKQHRIKTVSGSTRTINATNTANGRKPIDATAVSLRSSSKSTTRKAIEPHASSSNESLAPQYKLIPLPNLAKMDALQRRFHFKVADNISLEKLKTEKLIAMAKECQIGGLISSSAVLGDNTKKLDLINFMRANVFEFENQEQ
mmetsp:Transcript_6155/g.9794  ORF Transcript_6155/g.9794 Transcript_6155/m.9794 type:complete len:185 (+) Transcript_6155:1328-1882(+)